MKTIFRVAALFCLLALWKTVDAQVLQQQFSNSFSTFTNSTLSDVNYISATPSNSQFTASLSTAAAFEIKDTASAIAFKRNNSGTGTLQQDGGAAFIGVTSVIVRFDVSVTSPGNSTTNPVMFGIGDYTSGNRTATAVLSSGTPLNTHAFFGIGCKSTPSFYVALDQTTIASPTHTYTGTQTITFVDNNSGGSLTYKAPDGSFESVANDTYDLWVGTTKELNDQTSIGAAQAMTGMRMTVGSSGNGTIWSFDNLLIDPIPAAPTSNAASAVNATDFTANWNTVSGVTGYRLDVATDVGFTSFVSGYNDHYVSGQSTNSTVVSGLSASATYYYRVRAASQYTVGEYAGGNSGTQTVGTALPVELTSFTGSAHGRNVELLWNTATEINNSGFEIQRTIHSGLKGLMDWQKVGFVDGSGTSNIQHSYKYVDANSAATTYSYRLKQIDRDGKFTYSNAIEVITTLTADDFKLSQNYPNPFNPSTKLSFAVKNAEQTSLKIYNVVGEEVATLFNDVAQPNQVYTLTFDAKNFSSGMYYYVLHSASRNEVKKMMLLM